MNVEMWPIAKPKPSPSNPRKISKRAVDEVVKSLTAVGWRQPIVVDGDGFIIVGHTRLKAAKRMKMKEVPVHQASDLTPEQIDEYRVRDNKSGEYSEWNVDMLQADFSGELLADMGFDDLGVASDFNEIFDNDGKAKGDTKVLTEQVVLEFPVADYPTIAKKLAETEGTNEEIFLKGLGL